MEKKEMNGKKQHAGCPAGMDAFKLGDRLGSIDSSCEAIKDMVGEVKDALETQNGRIRKLEHWRSALAGIIGFNIIVIIPITLKLMDMI